jgi:outer membrane protein OmpA-like peptidoglycan-associated protein
MSSLSGRARVARWSLAVLAAVVVLAGCTRSGDGARAAPAPAGPTVAAPATSKGPDGRPVSELSSDQAPVSQLEEVRAAGSSVSEVETALSDLHAKRTPEGIVITLPDKVLFDFDKADVRPDARGVLGQIALVARHYGSAPMKVNGHTDAKGSDAYNLDLSQRRADSVKRWLVERERLGAGRIATKGFGETRPVAPNTRPDGSDNPEGRQQNRRVEVIIAA